NAASSGKDQPPPRTSAWRMACSLTTIIGRARLPPSRLSPGSAGASPPRCWLRLMLGHIARHRLQRLGRAGHPGQVVAVDVDRLDAAFLDLERERIARLDGLGVVDSAFKMTVVHLRRAHEWEEARRIDAIDEALDREVEVLAELLVNPGNPARDARHRP